jgi:hypothetical protein
MDNHMSEVSDATVPTYWSHKRVLTMIRFWADEHGEPPRQKDWLSPPPGFPCSSTVRKRFGTWTKALRAAGYEPRRQSRPRGEGKPHVHISIRVPLDVYSHLVSLTETSDDPLIKGSSLTGLVIQAVKNSYGAPVAEKA